MEFKTKSHNCPLCNGSGNIFYSSKKHTFHQCNVCKGIYLDKEFILNAEEEKLRYQKHNNDVNDKGYQEFVSPITDAIFHNHTNEEKGLDFGAGSGPVIAKILSSKNYNFSLYDPFFHNKPELLKNKYNYIASCEVIEHFHNPYKEFKLLKSILKKGGHLYCMTSIYNKNIDFRTWYYKNDQTHVFIYTKETLDWIAKEFGFISLKINNNFIEFSLDY